MAGKAPFAGKTRSALQIAAIALALGILAIPPVVVATSGTATISATWTALRMAGLFAFSLIFMNIVTGSFRPILNRIFKPRNLQQAHMATDLVAFCLALSHGILVVIFGLAGYNKGVVVIGPIVLVLLAVIIVTAIMRRRLWHFWRWIHRLNYLIFAAVLVHGLILGYDLKNEFFLKVCFVIYAVVVAAGLVYRITTDKSWTAMPRRPVAK